MAIISEYVQEQKVANAKFDLAMTKASATLEAAFNDMNLFMGEAELKVMKESGTDDDLRYYREEATEGFIGKAREVILAIIEALKDFFSELKSKIVKLFTNNDVTKTLDEVDKKARINPFLKNKKVKIPDFNKQDEVMKDYDRRLGKLLARSKAGDKVAVDDVEDEEEKFNKAWAAALAAVTTITVVALVALTRKLQKSIDSDVDSVQKETIGRMKNAEDKIKDMVDPDKVALLTKITQKTAQNAKRESSWRVNALVKCISALKKAVHNKDAFVSSGDSLSYESGDDTKDVDLDKISKDLEKDKDLQDVTNTDESCTGKCECGDEPCESPEDCDSCGEDDPIASSVKDTCNEFDDFLDASTPDDGAVDHDYSVDDDSAAASAEIDDFVNAMDVASADDDSDDVPDDVDECSECSDDSISEAVDDLMSDIDSLV